MIHELKILPEFFKAVKKGKKTFEIRVSDRPYKVNDHLLLKEYTGTEYTGEEIKVRVKYILDDENYLLKNTVAMAIEILDSCVYPSESVTAIKIDYYEELKSKADKYDEKETPYEPTNAFELYATCKCNHVVKKRQVYCSHCSQHLDWSNL